MPVSAAARPRPDLRGARAHLDELTAINTTRGKTTASGYSLAALIRSRLTDPSLDIRPDEGQHEKRVSDAIRAAIPEQHRSPNFYLPMGEELRPQAGITTGTWRGGGALTARRLDLGEVLRPVLSLQALGARRIDLADGWSGRASTQAAKVSSGWADPTTGETFNTTTMALALTSARPREVTATVEASRLMLKQTDRAEGLVRELIGLATLEEGERASVAGSGKAGQPLGLLEVGRIGVLQRQPVAGAMPTWAELTAGMQRALNAPGCRLRSTGWLLPQADWDDYASLQRPGGNPALVEGPEGWTMAGRPVEFSEHLPSGRAIAGAFDECEMTYQGIPQLLVNPYTKANQSVIRISVFDYMDFTVRRPQFLCLIGA